MLAMAEIQESHASTRWQSHSPNLLTHRMLYCEEHSVQMDIPCDHRLTCSEWSAGEATRTTPTPTPTPTTTAGEISVGDISNPSPFLAVSFFRHTRQTVLPNDGLNEYEPDAEDPACCIGGQVWHSCTELLW